MICDLRAHTKGYSLSLYEAFYSLGTGFRAPFYAQRHFELSRQSSTLYLWAHRIIGALEYLPAVGLLIGMIEKVIAITFSHFHRPHTSIPIDVPLPTPAPRLTTSPAAINLTTLPIPTSDSLPRESSLGSTTSSFPSSREHRRSVSCAPRVRRQPSPALSLEATPAFPITRPIGSPPPLELPPPITEEETLLEATGKAFSPPLHDVDLRVEIENTLLALREKLAAFGPSTSSDAVPEGGMLRTLKATFYIEEMALRSTLEPIKTHQKKPNAVIWAHASRAEARGSKKTMEDFSFTATLAGGFLAAIFDGHAGTEAACYANLQFERNFEKALKTYPDNIPQAIIALLALINERILKNERRASSGTTALVCFLDRKTHILYTASLGDSEAYIFRKTKEGLLKGIPLSCIRNWGHPEEAARAAKALKNESIATHWTKRPAADLYFPSFEDSLDEINVSRALGDAVYRGPKETPGVIDTPIVTALKLEKGDTLVMGSDGLWSTTDPAQICAMLTSSHKKEETSWAELLVEHALKEEVYDNTTAIVEEIDTIEGFYEPIARTPASDEEALTTPRST